MPIHLPPISRRQFLLRTLAAGAGLGLSPNLLAAPRKKDANAWVLLADTHLAGDAALNARGVNMADHFKNVSGQILAWPTRPAGVLLAGDCAFDAGQSEDYAALVDLLGPLRADGLPVHLALGNHDNRERFWKVLKDEGRLKHPVPDRQVTVLYTRQANWFILDSLHQTKSTPGLLGSEQLTWLGKSLDSHRDKPALVVIHHNPGVDRNLGLIDTGALFEVIRPRSQVKAYIYGHTHAWNVEQDSSGIHLINLPPVAYVFREGDPSGWVHARLTRGGMKLELRCVDPAHKDHGQIRDLTWRA